MGQLLGKLRPSGRRPTARSHLRRRQADPVGLLPYAPLGPQRKARLWALFVSLVVLPCTFQAATVLGRDPGPRAPGFAEAHDRPATHELPSLRSLGTTLASPSTSHPKLSYEDI